MGVEDASNLVVVEDGIDLGLEMSSTCSQRSYAQEASSLARVFQTDESGMGEDEANLDSDSGSNEEGDDVIGNPIHLPSTLAHRTASGRRATVL